MLRVRLSAPTAAANAGVHLGGQLGEGLEVEGTVVGHASIGKPVASSCRGFFPTGCRTGTYSLTSGKKP